MIKKLLINLAIKSLKSKGFILITVCIKYCFQKDIILGHYRRYIKQEIINLFKNFETVKLTFFKIFLFLPIAFIIIFLKILRIDFFIDEHQKSPKK